MASEGMGGSGEAEARVTRGFEDLVRQETLLPATQSPLTPSAELQQVDSLESRVRMTMDRLTELVEAQLPEAVDGLRADFEQLRTELREGLEEARNALAEERFQLRSQIATTVGAANRWFVRTRDQLFERLDDVARVASAAQAEAEAAASAAVAAAVPIQVEEGETGGGEEYGAEPAAPDTGAELEWGADDLSTGEPDGAGEYTEPSGVQEAGVDGGYDFELERPGPAASVAVNLDAPELDALLEPLRGDMQELQGEISAMGMAVMALREEVGELSRRIPTRTASPRLTPTQLRAIVEAVQSALPAAPARSRSTKATAAKRATTGTRAAAKKAPVGKKSPAKSTTAKRATRATPGRSSPTARRRSPG